MKPIVDSVLIGTVGISIALCIGAIYQAITHPLRQQTKYDSGYIIDDSNEPSLLQRKVILGWPIIILVLPLIILITKDTRTSNEARSQLAARLEIQAAYEAAAQPSPNRTATHIEHDDGNHAQGYVYVGQCDKQWVPNTRRFGSLPSCDADISEGGITIVSWKGDIIRDALPRNDQSQRRLGIEISRVSAGNTLVLRKLIPTSLFPSGPQYYWGLVDFPAERNPVQ